MRLAQRHTCLRIMQQLQLCSDPQILSAAACSLAFFHGCPSSAAAIGQQDAAA